MILIQHKTLAIRLMQDNLHDYQLMTKWLTDERVLEFVFGRDQRYALEEVQAKYRPRILKQEPVVPCIFLEQTTPIGYLQYYPVTDAIRSDYDNYGAGESSNIYASDLFIGEPNYWGRGIGTYVLSMLLHYLFKSLRTDKVIIDPRVANTRAVCCYEKCGFVKLKRLPKNELHEGQYEDCWLMVIDRAMFDENCRLLVQ